jgi:hypothetical protein
MERLMKYYVNPLLVKWRGGGPRRSHELACGAGVVLMTFLVLAALASSARAAAVGLGTADSFAVLGSSTVTNTGPSVISGDLGVSPASAVTGFPPGIIVGGTLHAADGVALQAQNDLVTAYNDAAGRSSSAVISADLAGRTLTPGVYTSATSLGLSGDLTLDGGGDPDAVFVFKAGSALNVGSGSRILFIGGAQPCNVFWQVGSSATIGAGSAFAGDIVALTSISLTTGATLQGRALARNGAVTLDTNTITKTTCAAAAAAGAPTAVNTTATTPAGQPVTVVLGGGPGTYTIIQGPAHGTLGPIDQNTGTVVYTPAPGYSGPDAFTYVVGTVNGVSPPAIVRITVTTPGGTTPGGPTTPRLRGPTRCVSGPFSVRATGRGIAQVTFSVDGRRRSTVKAKRGRSVFSLRVNPSKTSRRVHRVAARISYTAASGRRARTLRVVYQRCARAGLTSPPRFTG